MHKYNLSYIADTPVKRQFEWHGRTSHLFEDALGETVLDQAYVLPSQGYDDDGLLTGGIVYRGGVFVELRLCRRLVEGI